MFRLPSKIYSENTKEIIEKKASALLFKLHALMYLDRFSRFKSIKNIADVYFSRLLRSLTFTASIYKMFCKVLRLFIAFFDATYVLTVKFIEINSTVFKHLRRIFRSLCDCTFSCSFMHSRLSKLT